MKHVFYLLTTILFIVNVTLSQPTGSTAGIVTAPRYVKTDTVKPTLAFNVIGNFKATGTITTPLTAGTVRSSAGGVLSVTPSDTAGLAALLAAKQNNSDTATSDETRTSNDTRSHDWLRSQSIHPSTDAVPLTLQGSSISHSANMFNIISYNGSPLFNVGYNGLVTTSLGTGTVRATSGVLSVTPSDTAGMGALLWGKQDKASVASPDTNRTWNWLQDQKYYSAGDGLAGFTSPGIRFHTNDNIEYIHEEYSEIRAYNYPSDGDSGNTLSIKTNGLDINSFLTSSRTFNVNVNGQSPTENAVYINTANNTNTSYVVYRATEDGDQQKSVNFGYNPSTYLGSGLFRAKRGILSSGNSADSGWVIYAQASGSPIIFGGGSYPGTEWTRWDDAGYFYHAGGKFTLNTTGQITKLNNIATEGGFGTPAILDTVMRTNQTTSITATNFTGASTAGGMYEVTYYLICTTASGTATVTVGVVATDGVARTQTSESVSMASTSNIKSGTFKTGLSTGSVQWQTTVTGTISSAQYKVAVVCKRVF